jgi:tetratricopeptide (TPR) repeat protein
MQILQQAIAHGATSVPVQVALANLLDDAGQAAAARAKYEEIVAASPNAAGAVARLATLHADQRENLREALKLATGAREQTPDDPRVRDALRWVYVRSGLSSTGIPHLDAAVRSAPTVARFRYHLGIARLLQGDVRAARAELARPQHGPQLSWCGRRARRAGGTQ